MSTIFSIKQFYRPQIFTQLVGYLTTNVRRTKCLGAEQVSREWLDEDPKKRKAEIKALVWSNVEAF